MLSIFQECVVIASFVCHVMVLTFVINFEKETEVTTFSISWRSTNNLSKTLFFVGIYPEIQNEWKCERRSLKDKITKICILNLPPYGRLDMESLNCFYCGRMKTKIIHHDVMKLHKLYVLFYTDAYFWFVQKCFPDDDISFPVFVTCVIFWCSLSWRGNWWY